MRTHSILHTYINRHGQLESRCNTTCNGATDAEARALFDAHTTFAAAAWKSGRTWNGVPVRITGVVLVDAAEKVLAEWTHVPEMERAA